MRFLLFNVVVGLALIFLFNDGKLAGTDLTKLFEQARGQVSASAEQVVATAKQSPKDPKGHARDVIPEPAKPAPKPAPPKPKQKTEDPARAPEAPAPPPQPKPKVVAEKLPPAAPDLEPAVAKRRAEVLAETIAAPQRRVALSEGASLMSARERRRELDALAEEMELIYLRQAAR